MTIKQLQKICYAISVSKGFWGDVCQCISPELGKGYNNEYIPLCIKCRKRTDKFRNNAEMIALMHSELSEALEALRKGNPQSKKIPKFKLVEEELGDCIIRILDMAEGRNLNIEGAIRAKIKYNRKRPYKHNKQF